MFIFHEQGNRGNEATNHINSPENLLKEIEAVKNEWYRALERFHHVSEPEAVDFIIYYILAAERRYMYLLNKYKSLQNKDNKKKIIREASVEVILPKKEEEE